MGWKSSMIAINKTSNLDDKSLLKTLGFLDIKENGKSFLDSNINPKDGLVYIAEYNGCTIICVQEIPLEFLSKNLCSFEVKLIKLFPDSEISSFILHSVVNLWGYSLCINGKKVRARGGTHDTGTYLDYGLPITEEEELLSKSSINSEGIREFRFSDDPNDIYLDDQVGENFVFALSQRYFGEALDRCDGLLFETEFRAYSFSSINSTNQEQWENKSKIVASESVFAGEEINFLFKKEGIWIVGSRLDFGKEEELKKEEIVSIDEQYLYDRIPNLKGKLDQEDNTMISVDYQSGEIHINPRHKHIGIPTHDAVATRQANAGFDMIHYLKTTRSQFKTPTLIILALFIAAKLIGWFFYIPFIAYLAFKLLELFKTRDMYYSGALNPAIVIDAQNNKIAAFTDLSMGIGDYPIIRIKKYPLPEKYLINGTRIPIAGAYQNTEEYSHWNYFMPQPLPSGIKDEATIQNKINMISTEEWTKLKLEVKKFNTIPLEGYYPIDIENSSWKGMDLESIKWMQFSEEKAEKSESTKTQKPKANKLDKDF